MTNEDYLSVVCAVEEQEKKVRVQHFTYEDMLTLGLQTVNAAKANGESLSVAVYAPTGALVFQHLMPGTNAGNESWMRRKFRVCAETEHATLRAWAKEVLTGETMADLGMRPETHVFSGGAFPVRLTGGELVGVIVISGFQHFIDHKHAVDALAAFAGITAYPEVPFFDVWRA